MSADRGRPDPADLRPAVGAGGVGAARGPGADPRRRPDAGGHQAATDRWSRARSISFPSFSTPAMSLVMNTSGTIPAAVDVVADDGTELVVHLSTRLDDDRWVVEPRRLIGRSTERWDGPLPSAHLHGSGGATIALEEPYGDRSRLWVARLHFGARPLSLAGGPRASHPVRLRRPALAHRDVPERLRHRARERGDAQRGRPFTPEVITRLVAKGVAVTPLVLHTGVASLEAGRAPLSGTGPRCPAWTAERVNAAHRTRQRVVAVGTTVVRALETSVGRRRAGPRLRRLDRTGGVPGATRPDHRRAAHRLARTGLVPSADARGHRRHRTSSGTPTAPALAEGYRWHEFGDVHLILP